MIFETANKSISRPVRLSDETRLFAYESLNRRYGLETAATPAVILDGTEGFDSLPDIDRYDIAIRKIAEEAPLRIVNGEKLTGSATLGLAIDHNVPATFGGKPVFASVSHLTIDFEKVVSKGLDSVRDEVRASLRNHTDPDRIRFLESCISTLDSFDIWHKRYIEALKERSDMKDSLSVLMKVPHRPAESFREGLESIWFVFAFERLCGNWPGIGRIDWLLGGLLRNDLEKGVITLDEARELMAHFFIKGCEWIKGGNYISGDAQHYQNLVLAGTDGDGNDVTNEVTYLVLDVIEELGISDFPTTVRLNSGTKPELLKRCAEIVRLGGGILAFYNEELVIRSMRQYGIPACEAWKFANDGCWEVQIPGKTYFIYTALDSLGLLENRTLDAYSGRKDFGTFEELYEAYKEDLFKKVREQAEDMIDVYLRYSDDIWAQKRPCTAVSILEEGCIEKGLSYQTRGPVYNYFSIHIGGLPDTVNSLYAIKKLIFEEKKLTFSEFTGILKNDWEGHEALRQYVLGSYSYYGNDNDECDEIAAALISDFADACDAAGEIEGFRFPAGVSTFGRQLEWKDKRLSSPFGRKKSEVLAANFSPTPGTDREGATAVIKSYCKADLSKTVSGAALDLKLSPSSFEGEDGIAAISSLLRGFVKLGGFFIQPDVQDPEILRDAQLHPEDHSTLSVRVSGWNARFVTLDKCWQDMVIDENTK